MSIRVARTALPAVLAFALAVALATADLSTGSGDASSAPEGWVSSAPAAHGIATMALPAPLAPPFASPVTYAVGTSPTGLTAGDFNHDDNQDLATSNSLSDNVATLLGTGGGAFGAAAFKAVGFEPSSVTVGHFNGDEHLDIVTANSASDDVSLLLGNGDGTFQDEVFFGVGAVPIAILAGDYNEDGFTDVATANAFFDDVSILLGTGDGSFQTEIFFPVGIFPFGLAQGDYNGDDHLDISVVNVGDATVSVLLGAGDGTFGADTGPFPVGTDPVAIASGDLNGDTLPDIVTANVSSDDVSVLLGNGDGTFQGAVAHAVGSGPFSVALADFDRNGTLDLATADIGSVTILLGIGDATFMMAQAILVDLEPFIVLATDVNGDDFPDVIVGNTDDDSISVLLNQFNRPPVANAGADQTIECGAPDGTAVTLDGSSSSDSDDDEITYKWTGSFPEGGGVVEGVAPVVTLPLGVTEITLVVSDGSLESEADSVSITVSDTTAPTLTGSFSLTSDFPHWGDPRFDHGDGGTGDGKGKELLVVEFAASDACDPAPPTVEGMLLPGTCPSVPATTGSVIEFDQKKKCDLGTGKRGDVTEITGPSLTLHLAGADAAGNQATFDVPYVPCDDGTVTQPRTQDRRRAPATRSGGKQTGAGSSSL